MDIFASVAISVVEISSEENVENLGALVLGRVRSLARLFGFVFMREEPGSSVISQNVDAFFLS